jgi:hypothetical protein
MPSVPIPFATATVQIGCSGMGPLVWQIAFHWTVDETQEVALAEVPASGLGRLREGPRHGNAPGFPDQIFFAAVARGLLPSVVTGYGRLRRHPRRRLAS